MTKLILKAFDYLVNMMKGLTLSGELNDEEASKLATVVDDVNQVREQYVDRKTRELH